MAKVGAGNFQFFSQESKHEEKDFLLNLEKLTQKALSNNASAQLILGLTYWFGWKNCQINVPVAYQWIEAAAKNGNSPAALCAQGFCYAGGIGGVIVKDPKTAKQLYQQVAKDCLPAQLLLANMLFNEELLNQSQAYGTYNGFHSIHTSVQHINESRRALAIQYYTNCAKAGFAQYELGNCFQTGWGVQTDLQQAITLYTYSVANGDADARYYMGRCYDFGNGVPQSTGKAQEMFKLAAAQGHAEASKAVLNDCIAAFSQCCCVIL